MRGKNITVVSKHDPRKGKTDWARVASLTKGDWLITRDTVFFDTLASRAMSLIVALRPLRLAAPFNPADSGVVPLVPDVLVLGMLLVLAPPSGAKAAAVYASNRGWTKGDRPL